MAGYLFTMELLITLGVSLHKKMTEAGTQTAGPVVILTACLFSFVTGKREMRSAGTTLNSLNFILAQSGNSIIATGCPLKFS